MVGVPANSYPGLVDALRGKQRRYRPTPLQPNNEEAFRMNDAFEDNWQWLYDQAPDVLKHVVQGGANFQRGTQQLSANMMSGAMQIPTDVAALVDLVRIGGPALIRSIPDQPGEEDTYLSRLGEDFTRGMFSEQGITVLEEAMKKKAGEFAAAKPDATPEQLASFLDQYQDSQEFFDLMTMQMSPGMRLSQQWNNTANQIVGLRKRPDQQTVVDDIEQILGQSIVGLPSSVVKALGNQARKLVGDAVFDSVAGKVTLKGLELATPMTLPLTPGNAALNAGVGAGITEATRKLSGLPSILNGGVAEFAATELDPPDGHGVNIGGQIDGTVAATGMSLGGLFALPAFRRAASQAAANSAVRAIDRAGLDAGPSLADQADRLDPLLSPATGLVDANAPVKKGANIFDASDDVIDHLDAQLSAASTVNRIEAEVNAVNHGILANHAPTIPIVEIQRAARQLDPQSYDLLNKYIYAKQRDQDYTIYHKSLQTELSEASFAQRAAAARGDVRAANTARDKIAKLNDELTKLQNDDPATRSSMVGWSRQDVKDIIRVAEQNGPLMEVAKAMQKVSNDLISFVHKNGKINSEEATRRANTRPLYIPLRERAYPDVDNAVARQGLLFRDKLLGRSPSEEGFYVSSYTRNVSGEGAHVNKPKDALVALQEALMDAVRDVTANNARREIIKTLKSLPDAEGKLFRQHEFNFGNRKVKQISDAQYQSVGRAQIEHDRDRFIRVVDNGMNEFYEFSDPSITKSLQFAPLASVPILNGTRKLWQIFTTGLGAPWFAAKSALWDVPMARLTSRQGRSLGLMDTWARRMFNESPIVNAVMDHVPDPTAWISVAGAIPYQMAMRASRAVGQKIASDLTHNNGFFNMVAQVPGGQQWLGFVGDAMSRTFDRSVFNVYSRHLSTSMSHLMDAQKIGDDYVVRGKGTELGAGFRSAINAYKAAVESVQNSTRMAFFAENYGRLKAKHNGKVPKGELEKLVQETRNLTGDMSRVSNSKFVQGLTSVVPYGNPILQGTRHLLGSTIPPVVAKGINKATKGKANMIEARTNKFWSQYVGGMLLPTLGAMTLVDQWPGMQDWWYNKIPEWQQASVIPFPTYEAIQHLWEHGEWPEFDPKYVHMLPIAPEFGIVNAPVIAGLRAMGLFGPSSSYVPSSIGSQLASAFDQITSFATPPVLQALAAYNGGRLDLRAGLSGQGFFQPINPLPFGGANADMMTTNSDIPKQLYDVIGALVSSSGQMIAQSWNVGQIAMEDGDDFGEAFGKAFETFKYEAARKLPNVPGLPGVERNYSFTPESRYVYDTERKLEPLIGNGRQRTVELDSKDRIETLEGMGLIPPNQISEPLLRQMTEDIYAALRKKGQYKLADEQYTEKRVQLTGLEASRGKWPEDAYHAQYNKLIEDQQALKGIQARLLTQLQSDMQNKYGRFFTQLTGAPLTFETLVDAVRKNVDR